MNYLVNSMTKEDLKQIFSEDFARFDGNTPSLKGLIQHNEVIIYLDTSSI